MNIARPIGHRLKPVSNGEPAEAGNGSEELGFCRL